ncbi:wnt inhibitory factor 1-like isoform X2 [Tubulanus polymorphus]|uniref:wnt inhibitory factor 1-like isoform X2 n=1 Tax=Tubulanus polymorphus TaxID=672921 RepID=UPI003DA4199E
MRMHCSLYVVFVALVGGVNSLGLYHNHHKLAMWIDENVIQQFFGVPYEIYIIKDGAVIPYLKTPRFFERLPPIPSNVYLIKLTWQAGKQSTYWYYFAELRSLDPSAMYDPLLSIPATGRIPSQQTSFEIAIPCTGRSTDIARLQLTLHINDNYGRPVEGSPLRLNMRKQCKSQKKDPKGSSATLCDKKCLNGGRCNDRGICNCVRGYVGSHCDKAVCRSSCQNNGRCVAPNKCQCLLGYSGSVCQFYRSHCQRICGPHGRCVGADMCRCDFGWHGRYCNKRHRSPSLRMLRRMQNRRTKRERRKRRRRIRMGVTG